MNTGIQGTPFADIERETEGIVRAYRDLVLGMHGAATVQDSKGTRAYGGIVRAGKGKLVEQIGRHLVEIAWHRLGGDLRRLSTQRRLVTIPIRRDYVKQISDPRIRQYIRDHINDYVYALNPDVPAYVDGALVMGLECKAYTENAMLKRILVDFTLLKIVHPQMRCALLQLESQLGGDYSDLPKVAFGSPSTHTLLSYFDVDLHVLTLLKGERHVDEPIHKKEYFKPLTQEAVLAAIGAISRLLEPFAARR